jgi:hypothetical protein
VEQVTRHTLDVTLLTTLAPTSAMRHLFTRTGVSIGIFTRSAAKEEALRRSDQR